MKCLAKPTDERGKQIFFLYRAKIVKGTFAKYPYEWNYLFPTVLQVSGKYGQLNKCMYADCKLLASASALFLWSHECRKKRMISFVSM